MLGNSQRVCPYCLDFSVWSPFEAQCRAQCHKKLHRFWCASTGVVEGAPCTTTTLLHQRQQHPEWDGGNRRLNAKFGVAPLHKRPFGGAPNVVKVMAVSCQSINLQTRLPFGLCVLSQVHKIMCMTAGNEFPLSAPFKLLQTVTAGRITKSVMRHRAMHIGNNK